MRILLSIFFIAGLLSSCGKSPRCWGDDKNKGIINSTELISCEPVLFQENYVITSDSVYQQTFADILTGQPNCVLPSIDFSTHTLLGVRATGQCELKAIREVTKMDNEKKYHFKVTVISCGICKKLSYKDNWVTVPKLPDGWTVTFEIEEK